MKHLYPIFTILCCITILVMNAGCVYTDAPFGNIAPESEMKEWDGWWCSVNQQECIRVSTRITHENEILIDYFEDNITPDPFSVFELRKAPNTANSQDMFWFGFSKYECSHEECAHKIGDITFSEDHSLWVLIRKDKNELLIWPLHNEKRLEESIQNNELAGDYHGANDFRLLGSILTDKEIKLLLDEKYHLITSECPMIFIRNNNPINE